MDPTDCRYAKSHEWARLDGDVATVGITKFAVEQLTDVTYVKLPAVGTLLTPEKGFGEVESVKAVSDLYSPVAGTVVEVNSAVESDPALIGSDPYGKGWLLKVKLAAGASLDHLMTAEQYQQQLAADGH